MRRNPSDRLTVFIGHEIVDLAVRHKRVFAAEKDFTLEPDRRAPIAVVLVQAVGKVNKIAHPLGVIIHLFNNYHLTISNQAQGA